MRFDVARPVDLMDNAAALPTTPQARQQQRKRPIHRLPTPVNIDPARSEPLPAEAVASERADARLDVMAAVAIGRELKHLGAGADGVVVTDSPLLLNAKDVTEEACERHERRAGLFRRPGEASVVPGKVVDGEKAIGRIACEVNPASQNAFGRRSCSVASIRTERPRASGEYAGISSTPSWPMRLADLRRVVPVDFAAGGGRVPR